MSIGNDAFAISSFAPLHFSAFLGFPKDSAKWSGALNRDNRRFLAIIPLNSFDRKFFLKKVVKGV